MRTFILTLLSLCIIAFSVSSCLTDSRKQDVDTLSVRNVGIGIEPIDSMLLKRQQDSLWFSSNHHYTTNYNFIVSSDSLRLYLRQPEEIVSKSQSTEDKLWATELQVEDSVIIKNGDQLVVAEIRILPNDSIDSVWVQLARDQMTFGWVHESELLENVVPDDPISQFISVFSDVHLIWMIIVVALIVVVYTFRIIRRKNAKIVHLNDIPTFYPTLLVLIVAFAAAFYATIQLIAPEMWRHFYFHPTLNPFSVPPLLCVFLSLVWLMPIVGVATVDEVRRHLSVQDSVLYIGGLVAVCMVDYIVFTVFTLYYVGYVLLIVYVYYSIYTFNKHRRLVYYCGRCGKAIHRKGRCPHCGALNE